MYAGGANFGAKSGQLRIGYAGEFVHYSELSAEDYSTHRVTVAFEQSNPTWKFSADGSSLYVDGARDTLVSNSNVNANSISLWRERRQQWQHRLKLNAQYTSGALLFRAAANFLDYDYHTRAAAGHFAFADRSDAMAAVDGGWKQSTSSLWFVGGRVGRQTQAQVPLPNCAFDYSNDYTRLASGWEGKPTLNSTVSFAAGPDFRRYTGAIDSRVFLGGRDRTSLWFEGSFVSKPTPRITVTGKAIRMDWLSSTGKSAYIDTCAESSLTYALNPKTALRLSAKVHRCDYFPTTRDDYESLLGTGTTLKVSSKLNILVDVIKHRGWNNLSSVPEREFSRTLLMLVMAVQL